MSKFFFLEIAFSPYNKISVNLITNFLKPIFDITGRAVENVKRVIMIFFTGLFLNAFIDFIRFQILSKSELVCSLFSRDILWWLRSRVEVSKKFKSSIAKTAQIIGDAGGSEGKETYVSLIGKLRGFSRIREFFSTKFELFLMSECLRNNCVGERSRQRFGFFVIQSFL